jgi:serine/threonine protein kinase
MAPEQLEGGPVSSAADLYAFGLVLFEMVTGQRAFPSDTLLNGITQRLSGRIPRPEALVPDLPAFWSQAIEGCLRVKPEERFAAAGKVVATLENKITIPVLTVANPIGGTEVKDVTLANHVTDHVFLKLPDALSLAGWSQVPERSSFGRNLYRVFSAGARIPPSAQQTLHDRNRR